MEKPAIPTVSPEEMADFKKSRQRIVENAVVKVLKNQEFQKIFGDKSEDVLRSGLNFTAETLESIMAVSLPEIITQQLSWGNDYLPGIGIPAEMVLHNFEFFAESMQEILPGESHPALAVWMQMVIEKQRDFAKPA